LRLWQNAALILCFNVYEKKMQSMYELIYFTKTDSVIHGCNLQM
jgi:glutamine phosphoribosylpyrophosphate amidotransferase